MAAAEPDVYLIAQITPEKPRRGDTVQLDLQALQGAAYVDLDNLTARIIYYNGTRDNLTFTQNGTGRYVASFVMPLEVLRIDPVIVIAEGWRAGKHGTGQVYVSPVDMPSFVNPGLMLFGYIFSEGPLPYHFAPGDRLRFRVWTYLNGTLQEVGAPVGAGYLRPHGLPSGGTLTQLRMNTTRVGDGIYDITVDLPRDIHITNEGYISADVHNMQSAYGSAYAFFVDPLTAVAAFETGAGQPSDLRVCAARGATPILNASVTADFTYGGAGAPNLVTRGFLTSQDGCGKVGLEWPSNDTSMVSAVVTIRSEGDTTYLAPKYRRTPDPLIPEPVVQLPGDFVVELVGYPGNLSQGGVAHLSFAITQGGTPFASGTIGVIETWWRGDRTQVPVVVANMSTDAAGILNLSFTVPASWVAGTDMLLVGLYTPNGDEAPFNFGLGPYIGYPDWPPRDVNLTVAAVEDAANGTLHVHAAYNGTRNISGWQAGVFVRPLGASEDYQWSGFAGEFPTANLVMNGTVVDGDVILPPWLWEGDFEVIVVPYTFGRSWTPDPTRAFENSTVVHLHAAPHPPPAPNPPPVTPPAPQPSDNTVLVFAGQNLWFLLLLALLVAGVAAVLVATRRRKAADEEEPPL